MRSSRNGRSIPFSPAAVCAALVAAGAIVILSVMVALLITPAAPSATAATASRDPLPLGTELTQEALEDGPDYVRDSLLVSLADGVDGDALAASLAGLPYTVSGISDGFAELSVPTGTDIVEAVAELGKLPGIEGAQPNYIYYLADAGNGDIQAGTVPEGTLDAQRTSVDDPNAPLQWYLDSIGAYGAWDISKCGKSSAKPVVAVVDSGCDLSHPDLASNIVAYYDATSSKVGIADTAVHGTDVAGIVSAVSDNGIGISGVSYNAGILPIQIFENYGSVYGATSASMVRAYDYIIANASKYNIRVVNLSLGAEQTGLQSYDRLSINRIDKAYAQGILTVVAGGNVTRSTSKAPYVMFPCDWMQNGVGVIALDRDLSRASYSNYNIGEMRTKDIAAPGTEILSTCSDSERYDVQSGTSMACPVVSAVAALMFACDPSLTPDNVVDALHDTARDLGTAGFDAEYGYGEVDALAALELISDPAYVPSADIPSDPSDPADPSSPSNPSDPSAPGTPDTPIIIEPVDPSDPSNPSDPDDPAGPADPSSPDDPAIPSDPADGEGTVPLYRLYNPVSGEHLYTLDYRENFILSHSWGWNAEGICCWLPGSSSMPVYRLFNNYTGDHHYTNDSHERDVLDAGDTWTYEGVAWNSALPSDKGAIKVYRLYKPGLAVGSHHYTSDANERNILSNRDWTYEGVSWYGFSA